MSNSITINVNEACIASGTRDSAHWCAVALALKEQVPGVEQSSVSVCDYLKFDVGAERYRLRVPRHVQEFIAEFDGGEDPDPITFEIDLTEPE